MIICEYCSKCCACLRVCPENAVYDDGNQYQINEFICTECGECLKVCPCGAIDDPRTRGF